jgi:hypothetical protein
MKNIIILFLVFHLIFIVNISMFAQDEEITSIAPATANGENLDLSAVMALFQESKDLEDFERKLNEKDGVNNLDLNDDDEIDYIRVVEQQKGTYRIIVLQSVLGENQVQDVAVINVEQKSEKEVVVECEGNTDIYGPNYYVAPPPTVHVYLWPIWAIMFAPHYVVYRSPWHYHRYPPYWMGRPPVHYSVYHSRRAVVVHRNAYVYRRTAVVRRPPNVYRAHRSTAVVRRPPNTVNRTNRATTGNRTPNNNTNRSNVNRANNTNRSNVNRSNNTRQSTNRPPTTNNRQVNTRQNNYNRSSNTRQNNYNRSSHTNRSRPTTTTRPTSRYGGSRGSRGGGGRRR